MMPSFAPCNVSNTSPLSPLPNTHNPSAAKSLASTPSDVSIPSAISVYDRNYSEGAPSAPELKGASFYPNTSYEKQKPSPPKNGKVA